jgi:hypothetical protein
MAINSVYRGLGDPVLAEFVDVNEEGFEARFELDDEQVAVLFNVIRDRYDSSSGPAAEDEL